MVNMGNRRTSSVSPLRNNQQNPECGIFYRKNDPFLNDKWHLKEDEENNKCLNKTTTR